jgi:hypothetical protein
MTVNNSFLKGLKSDISYLNKHGAKLGDRVQSAISNLAQHVNSCGDWALINTLDPAVVKCSGLRVEGVRLYLKALLPGFKYDPDTNLWFRKNPKKAIVVNLDILKTPFYLWTNEAATVANADKVAVLTVEEIVALYAHTAAKRLETIEQSDKHTGDIAAAKARIKALVA